MTEEIIFDYKKECSNLLAEKNALLCRYEEIREQLKSLEQENRELGRKAFLAEQNVRTTAATFCEKDNKIKELEQENKELKAYKDINEDFKQAWDELNEKHKQFRSALEEIKEIVNQSCNNCKYNKDDITCSIGDCGEGKLRIIENKINEVLS